MYIRKARPEDIDLIAAVEAACFPPEEAASRDRLAARLAVFPECFWLGFDDFGSLLCYAAGPVTKEADLTDEMYADPGFHDPEGGWVMIFSVCTLPEHRRKGLARWLLNRLIAAADSDGRKGVVLTCKEELVPFYEKFGFVNEWVSPSVHGGARWLQMRITFDEDYHLEHIFRMSDDPDENAEFLREAFWGGRF